MILANKKIDLQPDIAIVICTYNPEDNIFSRTLKAIEYLEIPENLKIECVVVDNNSFPPLNDVSYVKTFLTNCRWAKLIVESQQGLSFARITGVKSTTAPIIIFIDDDNQPAQNYIKAVINCLDKYNFLAVVGPGKVRVEFMEPVSKWLDENMRIYFQERDSKYIEYGCLMAQWTNFYPYGTGLVVKREVFEKYSQDFQAGKLNCVGRKGSSLSSGDDLQIVWEAVKMGLAVGVSPELEVIHLIPGKRSNLQYIKRLVFASASGYIPALVSSFPSEKEDILASIPSNKTILTTIIKLIVSRSLKFKYRLLLIDLAYYIGIITGTLRSSGYPEYYLLSKFIRYLKFD